MKKALIITVFNEEKSTERLIKSILTQTELPSEVVIVDGGSRDETVSSIRYQVSGIKRIKFGIFIKKGNRSVGRNEAIKRSTADIIAITDAGCILDKNWFKNITKPLEEKSVDVVAGYYKAKPKNIFEKSLVPYVLVMPDQVNSQKFLPATRSMAIRKNLWNRLGKFDETLSNNEDYDFAKKIEESGAVIKFQRSAFVYWIPRSNLRQTFTMFYRFAKGDAEAGIFRPKVAFIFLRYIVGICMLISFLLFKSYIILNTLYLIFLLYIVWSIWKNYKYVRKPTAFIYLPLLQFVSDCAVIIGTLVVLITNFLPILSVGVFASSILSGINLPYVGQNAYNFITYSLIAHNYNQFGYLMTKLAPLISVASSFPTHPEYFIHHPPLLSVVESLFLRFLGEDFWVGRLVPALFTAGSLIAIYLIEKILSNKKEAIFALVVACLLPATSIFGKMIGQEPLVLFFILCETFFVLKYFKTGNNKFMYFGLLSAVFAGLSDWPGAYFSIFLLPLFIKSKKTKEGIVLLCVSALVVLSTIIWISWIRSGVWDLQNAVNSRLFTALLDVPLWPFRWVGTVVLRFIIYFNPLFTIMSIAYLYTILRSVWKKKINEKNVVILIFSVFALFHITLYAEASFTHPYLIYYFIPFFAFSSSFFLSKIVAAKQYIATSLIFLFSAGFLLMMLFAKEEQIASNIWRYNLAAAVRPYLSSYETVIYNNNYAIDHDIWWYPLLINSKRQDTNNSSKFLKNYRHYVYSCSPTCSVYGGQMKSLKRRYKYIVFKTLEGEAYLFFLQARQDNKPGNRNMTTFLVNSSEQKTDKVIQIYRKIRDKLMIPQI